MVSTCVCGAITPTAPSHLFVAFICDPLDLDLFPPHVSAVAVGGAKKGEWSRWKVTKDFFFALCETSGSPPRVLPVHAGQAHSRTEDGGGAEEQSWANGAFLRSWSRRRG